MSVEFPELDQVRVSVDPTTRDRHLSAIGIALRAKPGWSWRNRRLLAVALAALFLLPVLAVAAQDTVPGDLLYPIKRAVEPITRIFDQTTEAERRVEELEAMVDRRRELDAIRDQLSSTIARLEVEQVAVDERLEMLGRMEAATDSVEVGDIDAEKATLERMLADIRDTRRKLEEELAAVDRSTDQVDSQTGRHSDDALVVDPPASTTTTAVTTTSAITDDDRGDRPRP